MAFDWMQVRRAPARAGAHDEMFRAEIIERARLLRRLGFSQGQAYARIDAAARWEFTQPAFLTGASALVAQVEGLVAGVFNKT
jgi:hypothetical protein